MKISITGNRGEGKTTVAILLAKFLYEKGFDVRYRGATRQQTAQIACGMERKDEPDLSNQVKVEILDDARPESDYELVPVTNRPVEMFEHDCLICGQHLVMPYGVLHHCPGDRATGTAPISFLPLPNAGYELGRQMAEEREAAFVKALGIDLSNRKTKVIDYMAPAVVAEVGNVTIHADHHGMGFSCSIDGQPVKRLRAVSLTLEVDQPNLVTVEVLCDHRQPIGETHATQEEHASSRPAGPDDRYAQDSDGE